MNNNFIIIFGIIFILLGILFAFRIIIPKEVKKMYKENIERKRIKILCINVGILISLAGFIILLRGIWTLFIGKPFLISMIIWLIISGFDVYFISKKSKHEHK